MYVLTLSANLDIEKEKFKIQSNNDLLSLTDKQISYLTDYINESEFGSEDIPDNLHITVQRHGSFNQFKIYIMSSSDQTIGEILDIAIKTSEDYNEIDILDIIRKEFNTNFANFY